MASWYIKPQSLPPRWRSALIRRLRGLAGIRRRGGYGKLSASTDTSLWTGTCLTRPTREACSFYRLPGQASVGAGWQLHRPHVSSSTAPSSSGSETDTRGVSGRTRAARAGSGEWSHGVTFDVYSDDHGKTWRDRETGAVVDPDAEWERVIARRRTADEWMVQSVARADSFECRHGNYGECGKCNVTVLRRDADEWDTWGWITPPRGAA